MESAVFEAVFVAHCKKAFEVRQLVEGKLTAERLEELKIDSEFVEAIQSQTTSKENVKKRLQRAESILCNQL